MNNSFFCRLKNQEFLPSIFLQCSKLFKMIWRNRSNDSDIWLGDRKEKFHFTRMINAIFQNKIFRIRSQTTIKSNQKNPKPSKWISSTCFYSDNRKWKSVLTVIVIWRYLHFFFSKKRSKIRGYIARNRRFSDGSSNPNNKWFMNFDNHPGSKSQEKKEERMHNFFWI